jgi:hypothetical protein
MWASASSSPAMAAEAANLADRRKIPSATEGRRYHPAARRRGVRGGHGGTRWRRGRATPQGERGLACASRVQSERPRRRHHRECWGIQEKPVPLEMSSLTKFMKWAFRVVEPVKNWNLEFAKPGSREPVKIWDLESAKPGNREPVKIWNLESTKPWSRKPVKI